MAIKILYYNWIQFDDVQKRGGGVTVYQKNVLDQLVKEDNIECYFLSSGTAYSIKKMKSPYIEKTNNIYGSACQSFRVVNSPVLAPSFYQAQDLDPWLEDNSLFFLLKKFITENGPFQAIHFNNLEGLTLKCLYLKKYFPETKFIYSLHNYFPFCPGVNLWFHDMEICKERQFNKGYGCIRCPAYANPNHKKLVYRVETVLKVSLEKLPMYNFLKKQYHRMENAYKIKRFSKKNEKIRGIEESIANKNRRFREENVTALNENFDIILAVSERVHQIALNYGLKKEKVYTDYIGTKFAKMQRMEAIADPNTEYFRIAYMGYARNDKGFFLFMKSLELIPIEITQKIELVMAVRTDDPGIYLWFNELRHRFAKIIHYNGYTHEKLPRILDGVHLGVVPVLWEDNLPQVAIEMAANGVPVLASEAGGPSELSESKIFIVPADDKIALAKRIELFATHRQLLNNYWKKYKGLTTMEDHIKNLYQYYGI